MSELADRKQGQWCSSNLLVLARACTGQFKEIDVAVDGLNSAAMLTQHRSDRGWIAAFPARVLSTETGGSGAEGSSVEARLDRQDSSSGLQDTRQHGRRKEGKRILSR